MRIGVKMTGLGKVQSVLSRNIPEVISDARHEGTLKQACAVHDRIKSSTSYGFKNRTGRLRKSVAARSITGRLRARGGPGGEGAEVVAGNADADEKRRFRVFYARYVEYGYGGRHSYLRRAVRELRENGTLQRIADKAVLKHVNSFLSTGQRLGRPPNRGCGNA